MKTLTQNSHTTTQAGLQSHPEQSIVPTTEQPPRPWRGVFFDGPEADQDAEGEEIPVYAVYVGNEDGEPTGKVYRVHSFKSALALARLMSTDRRLELVQDAVAA
jgi:hypothetical protein